MLLRTRFTSTDDLCPWYTLQFYAPWCGHCKNLKDTWISLAKDTKGKASIGAVDCTKHSETCSKFGVRGYPTLKRFGADKGSPEQYSGARSLGDLVQFATGTKAEEKKAEEPAKDEFYGGTGRWCSLQACRSS